MAGLTLGLRPPTQLACRPACALFRTARHAAVSDRRQLRHSGRGLAARAAAGPASSAATAKAAVEGGLEAFEAGDAAGALRLFQRAMELGPDEDEARAALFNSACAHTRLQQWQAAADAVVRAVNEHDLRLTVAQRDDDLAPLRERREWTAALAQMRGGLSDDANVKLRAEARAPFRLTRIILLGGLAAGAGLGLLIITTRLIAALKGGEGAPELTESLQNFSINAAALAVLSFFVSRDLAAQSRDQEVVEREEALGQLQVQLASGRVVPLAAFRGAARPVVVAGSRGQLQKALMASEPYYGLLRERGVCLVPVELSDDDPAERLRRLKQELGTGEAPAAVSSKDRRWKLDTAEPGEWRRWAEAQLKAAGRRNECVYAQVQMDGRVRASGFGTPPWKAFVDDLPSLGSVRTKLSDGAAS